MANGSLFMVMNSSIVSLWQRLPVIVRAVIAGLAVLLAGERPWGGIEGHAALAGWNERVLVSVPWAIPPFAYLASVSAPG